MNYQKYMYKGIFDVVSKEELNNINAEVSNIRLEIEKLKGELDTNPKNSRHSF